MAWGLGEDGDPRVWPGDWSPRGARRPRAGPECSPSLPPCVALRSPTFSLFSWHSCLLGVASCLLMMFLISPGAAGGSLLLMGLLSALLTARGGPSSWGYVSQALLFHQVASP